MFSKDSVGMINVNASWYLGVLRLPQELIKAADLIHSLCCFDNLYIIVTCTNNEHFYHVVLESTTWAVWSD